MKSKKFAFLKWLDPFTSVDYVLEKTIGKQEGFWKGVIYWGCYLLTAFFCALILYKMIGLFLGVAEPLAIVVTSSMHPVLKVGDVAIFTRPVNLKVEEISIDKNIRFKDLKEFAEIRYEKNKYGLNEARTITIGEKTIDLLEAIRKNNSIVVFKSNTENKDIVHRAIAKINANDGVFILTKGDNPKTNIYIDQDCDISIEDGYPKIGKNCLNIYPLKLEDIQRKKIGKIPYIGYIKLVLFQ